MRSGPHVDRHPMVRHVLDAQDERARLARAHDATLARGTTPQRIRSFVFDRNRSMVLTFGRLMVIVGWSKDSAQVSAK